MNTRAETDAAGRDTAKLVASAALLAIGIWAFYLFESFSLLLRVIGLLAIAGGAAALALTTDKGRQVWSFIMEARMEVRKVVWPSRQETLQTTLIVVAMVFLVAIVLWMFDSVLMGILRFLTRQGG